MLSNRRRGKNGIYYIRGSVALGDKRIDVKEFSSGTSDTDAASHLMAEYETRLRHQLMFGPAAICAQGTFADAFDSYLSKAKRPCPSDILRIGKLNDRIGEPYQDTRLSPIPGGNPLKNQHKTACKRAGIDDFTIHDWRHHWASHCVMAGIDPITIMHMGGWKSLRMVQRYSSVSVDHMREAINKLS